MRIKNWDQFQHYSQRNPPWIRFYRKLLDDPEWFALSGDASKLLVNCWLIASECNGELPPMKTIAFRLRMKLKELEELISQLDHWLECDASTMLADRYQHARPDTESESDTDTESDTESEREREVAIAPPSPPRPKRAIRKGQLPNNWHPTESHYEKGDGLGFSASAVDEMAEDMRLWAGAKGETKSNWDMAFHGWLRRERKGGYAGRAGPQLSRTQVALQKIERELHEERINGHGLGRQGLCLGGGKDAIEFLPPASPRPGSLRQATDELVCREAEDLAEEDGASG
jgi:hypothetical protein